MGRGRMKYGILRWRMENASTMACQSGGRRGRCGLGGFALRAVMARAAGAAPLPVARATPGPCSSRPLAACWSIGRAVLCGRPVARLLGLRGVGGEGKGGWEREGSREAHLTILPCSAPEECEEGKEDQVLWSKVASLLLTVELSVRRAAAAATFGIR